MPEEIEVPTEHLHETLHEHAEHGGHGEHGEHGGPAWVSQVALSAAILAVLAAVSALKAGEHANEAMLEQMRATDEWAYYQAKGIKRSLVEMKIEVLEATKTAIPEGTTDKPAQYEKEQKEIEDKAKHEEHQSAEHMEHHETLAKSVTAFQVAIALSAISVLAKKKLLWFTGLAIGLCGVALFVKGLV